MGIDNQSLGNVDGFEICMFSHYSLSIIQVCFFFLACFPEARKQQNSDLKRTLEKVSTTKRREEDG
jgi:hypothetical protein